jgi:hypothetical protein
LLKFMGATKTTASFVEFLIKVLGRVVS